MVVNFSRKWRAAGISFFLVLSAPSMAQQELPKQVQADIVLAEITEAIRNNKPAEALDAIKRYRSLGVAIPPRLLFAEAKLAILKSDFERSETALEEYLRSVNKSDPQYAEAIKLYPAVQRAAATARDAKLTPAERLALQKRKELQALRQAWKAKFEAMPSLSVFNPCDKCPPMIKVPGGTFTPTYGHPDTIQPVIQRSAPAQIRPFALGQHEVTVGEWQICVQAGACRLVEDIAANAKLPITKVTSADISAYISWLSNEIGIQFRLPIVMEWEYAARSGRTTNPFYGYDSVSICKYANLASQRLNPRKFSFDFDCPRTEKYYELLEVMSRSSNDFGLFDLIGNVSEVMADCSHDNIDEYPTNYNNMPQSGCNGNLSYHGGNFLSGMILEIWPRQFSSPDMFTGFRIAASF